MSEDAQFISLLVHHGFAPEAVVLLAAQPITPDNEGHDLQRNVLQCYSDNYYMQFLAMQLERFGFQLNRPSIAQSELQYAAGLIQGTHGNPPLDMPLLATLLVETTEALVKAYPPLTWQELYDFVYHASDGSTIRGQDLVKALIKSMLIFHGEQTEHYHHLYRGRRYATLSMYEIMQQALADRHAISPIRLPGINAFGQPVNPFIVQDALAHLASIKRLSSPKFGDYVSLSAHNRIKQCLRDIVTILSATIPDFAALEHARQRLVRDYFNPGAYSRAWQDFFAVLLTYLRKLATPYV